jgi:ATP synthase subunit 6
MEYIKENFYKFIYNLIFEQAGLTGLSYIPIYLFIFIILLFSNYIGMFIFGFTITSHLFFTFFFSIMLMTGFTIIGFIDNNLKFITLFIPENIPVQIKPALIIIELISYVSRIFSLAIRLFANMMSGHVLLNILSGFFIFCFKNIKTFLFSLVLLIPIIIVFIIGILEMFIAFLQSYVFVVLAIIYINDCINLFEKVKKIKKKINKNINYFFLKNNSININILKKKVDKLYILVK